MLVRCQEAAQDYYFLKDGWPRLQHICDVAELIRANPALDWQSVVEQAGKLWSLGMLYLLLSLASDLLGAELPAEIRRQMKADPQIEHLTAVARQRLAPDAEYVGTASGDEFLERDIFCLKLKERLPLPPALSFAMLYRLSSVYYSLRGGLAMAR